MQFWKQSEDFTAVIQMKNNLPFKNVNENWNT